MRRLVDAIRAWLARVFGHEPPRDTKRELDEFFGS
jgi:hypothetical protein